MNPHGSSMYPYFGEYILKILPTLITATEKLNKNRIRKRRKRRRSRRGGASFLEVFIFSSYRNGNNKMASILQSSTFLFKLLKIIFHHKIIIWHLSFLRAILEKMNSVTRRKLVLSSSTDVGYMCINVLLYKVNLFSDQVIQSHSLKLKRCKRPFKKSLSLTLQPPVRSHRETILSCVNVFPQRYFMNLLVKGKQIA